MGRYSKKCRKVLPGILEEELPELIDGGCGVRSTSPRTKEEETSLETAEKRIREVGDGELDFARNSAFPELRRSTRRRLMIEAESESLSPAYGLANCGPSTGAEEKEANSSTEPASCCSSYASIQLVEDRSTIADPTVQTESPQLETLTFSGGRCSNSSEAIPSSEQSGDMESAVAVRTLRDSKSRFKSAVKETPSEVEIDDFLTAAESDLHKRFSEKYNFDAVKGVPLKGRYEWVPIKP
ncbi:hypothetical protein V2J09_021761 [Rumex salicifolius]